MPVADFTLPASVCMPGATNITNASSSPDGSVLTYAWDFDDASAIDNSTNPSHNYAIAGSYDIALKVTSVFGCVTNKVKTFSAFFDKPIADFDVNPTSLCQGNPNSFTDRSTAPGSSIASHLWTFGDNSTSADPSPNHTYALPGVYTVQLQVTSNENCVSNPLPKIVTVYLQPTVDAGPSFVVAQGTHVQFKPVVNDSTGVVYTWDPGFGLSNPNILRPIYIANADQEFTLYATGAGNCTATDKLSVKIYKPVKVPNAFSPNGDGVHDMWDINNINDYPEATVEVFNRYGQSVYRSAGYAKAWDGNYNGKPLPVATYYYVIKLGSGFQPMSGSVTILR
jgi:gliding motility-associated-like protein